MYPFGVTFYPDQWPLGTWEETFKQIKDSGLNIVRFGEMAWDWVEPEPGKYRFYDLDRALDICEKVGLQVLLGLPTSQVPSWFYRKYPNSQPIAQDGTLYPEYGPRPNICKDNPHYRMHAEKLVRTMVKRYAKHLAVAMWQVDNEPVYPPLDHTTINDFCHCEHTRQAFITWAKKKYGTIKNLNEAWGTRFWTTTFFSFEDILTPKAGIWEAVSPHIFLDWFRFKTDSLSQWINHLAAVVREYDKFHKVGTNGFVGICTRVPDHSKMVGNLDWYGLDIYPKGGRMDPQGLAFHYDLWRSFVRGTKAEFHITELQGGQNVRWGAPEYVEGPEIKGWTTSALDHGAEAILYHAWRPPLFGAETGGFGICNVDGTPSKRLEVIKKLAGDIRTGKLKKANLKAKVAIAYLRGSEIQTYQEQGPPRGIAGQWEAVRSDIGMMHAILSIGGAHSVLFQKGEPADFIFERELDSGNLPYKVILMPNPYLLSKKQYDNLKKWINTGGKLITEARFGLKNEMGHLYEHPLMEDLVGVKYEFTEPKPAGFLDGLQGKPRTEQVFTKKIGKGQAIYANFSLFLQIKNGNKKWASLVAKELA
ncbi:MAG: alpha-amylase family protein [Syntrophales bacterium]